MALLDRDGIVVGVNRAWRRFGLANGGSVTTGLGANYLAVCDLAAAAGETLAAEAGRLIRAALRGDDTGLSVTYPCAYLSGEAGTSELRWFSMRAVPLPGRHRGAIVLHRDVTSDAQNPAMQ